MVIVLKIFKEKNGSIRTFTNDFRISLYYSDVLNLHLGLLNVLHLTFKNTDNTNSFV